MALTVIEQLTIMSGAVSPDATDLGTLVKHCSFKYVKDFYDNVKDTSGDAEAEAYENKMRGICRNVLQGRDGLNANLVRQIVIMIGEAATNLQQVIDAQDPIWEDFVYGQMDEAFEYLSDVRANEKAAYIAL